MGTNSQWIRPCRSFFAAVCVLTAGCLGSGDSELGATVDATGRVTRDGQPFSGGSIRFTSMRTSASFATDLKDDGTYVLEVLDVRPGDEFGVSFGPLLAPSDSEEVDAAGIPVGHPPPKIPPKYFEHTTSGLHVTLTHEDTQSVDFDIAGK